MPFDASQPGKKEQDGISASGEWMLWSAALVVGVSLSAYGIVKSVALWRVLPIADGWASVSFYQYWLEGRSGLEALIMPHNEHRIFVTRLANLLDFIVFDGVPKLSFGLLLLGHIMLGVVLGALLSCGATRRMQLLASVIGIAFFVSPLQIENLGNFFQIQWFASALLAVGTFYPLAIMSRYSFGVRWLLLGMAMFCNVLGLFTSANGLVVVVLASLMALVMTIRRYERLAFLVASLCSIAFFAQSIFSGNTLARPVAGFAGIIEFVTYFAACLGQIIPTVTGAELAGVAGIIFSSVLILYWIGQCIEDRYPDAVTATLIMMMLASLGTAAMTAFGRAGFGIEQAMSSRYATWSLVFWFSMFAVVSRTWRRNWLRNAGYVGLAATLLLSYIVGAARVPAYQERAEVIDALQHDLRAGSFPEKMVWVYPNPKSLIPILDFMRSRSLSIFSH